MAWKRNAARKVAQRKTRDDDHEIGSFNSMGRINRAVPAVANNDVSTTELTSKERTYALC